MEIIVLPYMAISFSIAWAIFSPFAEIDDLQEWTFAGIETCDLFAIFLPFSLLWAFVEWTTLAGSLPMPAVVFAAACIALLTIFGFIAGLFLLAKMHQTSPAKRVALIGVVVPLGSLLSIVWFALPLLAYAHSTMYAIPAMVSVLPVTLAFRALSAWVCRTAVSGE